MKNNHISKFNIKKLSLILLAVILSITIISIYTTVIAANRFVDYETAWTRGDAYIQIYNRRTGKYTVGALDREYDNNVTTNDIYIGDVIDVEAHFIYNGGQYWRYEDGVNVHHLTDSNGENGGVFKTTFTVSKDITKVSCSCSENAQAGEQLSVTMVAKTDEIKPTVTLSQTVVEKGSPITISFSDNSLLSYYAVTTTSNVPTTSGWIAISPSVSSKEITYTPSEAKRYYVWAKDSYGNVSDVAIFDCGIAPRVEISQNMEVQVDDSVSFVCSVTLGTAPLTYQWYYSTTNTSTNNGIKVDGANSSRLTIEKATSDMDGRYYYCVVSNSVVPDGVKSSNALLRVYKDFAVSSISDVNLRHGQSYTLSVSITRQGNPNSYTYQWYRGGSETDLGAKIDGATSSTYRIVASEDLTEWVWCEVSNSRYTTTTNKACVRTDVNSPIITIGTYDEDRSIKQSDSITIPIIVTDGGQGYTESTSPTTNLLANEITIRVNGETVAGVTKTLTYKNRSSNNYNYNLVLTNIPSNGLLSLEFPASCVTDDFGNTNTKTLIVTKTVIDNILPTVTYTEIVSGTNQNYANKEKEIVLKLMLTESNGIDISLFEAKDVGVLINGIPASSVLKKKLEFIEVRNDEDYYYNLILTNVEGNGPLSLKIPAGSINDIAYNNNIELAIPTDVIIDNVAPIVNEFRVTHGTSSASADSGAYPSSLEEWHKGWTNKNVYIQINASDNGGIIDYYAKSTDLSKAFTKITTDNKDSYEKDYNNHVYYRIYDCAGNYAQKEIDIKIDKVSPNHSEVTLYEGALNGAIYHFGTGVPTSKNLFVKPDTPSDYGTIKSGIYDAGTYFEYKKYDNIGGTQDVAHSYSNLAMDESVTFTDDGYYEIFTVVTDLAGNVTRSGPYKAFLKKLTDNIIVIKNINDIGSGVKKCTITAYNQSNNTLAIEPIVIDNPYKEISRSLRLGNGTFRIVVTLEDYTKNSSGAADPNITTFEKIITNSL